MFVTHDIDEAVKLGDKVAVFGRGGVLQQYADPAFVLSNPANETVSGLSAPTVGYRGRSSSRPTVCNYMTSARSPRRTSTSCSWHRGTGRW